MRLTIGGILVALMVGLLPSALADTEVVEDSRDPNNLVDPIEATHGHHGSNANILVHTVRMAEPWQAGDLRHLTLVVWTPDGDSQHDREIVVAYNPDGSMVVFVRTWLSRLLGHGNAWMVDDRTIRFEFAKRLLGRGVSRYRWGVIAVFRCSSPPEGTTCFPESDRLPDEGKVLHELN